MGTKERKERERELRKGEILNTGEKLFVNKGFQDTTMDEIAAACELAKGTLYLHFRSKEELLSTILCRKLDTLHQMIVTSLKEGDSPIEKLNTLGKIHIEFYDRHPEYFRLISEVNIPGKFQPDITAEAHLKLIDRIRSIWEINIGIIQQGKDEGIFKESTDPFEVAVSLWAISTVMIKVIDFRSHIQKAFGNGEMKLPVQEFDFLSVITINAKRIIYSILKNPPENFEF